MGNQLVGIATSQIYPVEWYLKDHPEMKFEASLGSTRFLKVARALSQEGSVVVKVFAIRDQSLPLQSYKDRLEEIRKKLTNAVNCTPYQKFIITERAALIIREYVKYSLYDRISTRPFLIDIEKRWITFQILYSLHQCHKVGVCHGDIKLENITVSSWNWVMLVDFASFKPTYLPIDNPGDYSYFFDTSRRRVCYIAPERFLSPTHITTSESSAIISETVCDSGDLTPAMDIFSAGCALLELWNELHVPFEYSQLLAYHADKYSPQKHLDKLEDPNLKRLISSMIDRDPTKRLSAEDYLDQYRGTLFPEYFYSFLQSYMLIFSSYPIMSPDEKIARLKADIGNIFKFLGPVKNARMGTENDEVPGEKNDTETSEHRGECEGLVIIISLVTSCIRGLHEYASKLYSLEILLELAQHASDETILDRILPYLIFLVHDSNTRVKISAINIITKVLNLVQRLRRSDANIFPEYILPELAQLATDPNACVRAAYAKNISALASISLKYLDQIQNIWYGDDGDKSDGKHTFNYELELQALHEMVEQTVSALLTDGQSIVKQALINNGIHDLCVFFGKVKANDIILSHMITFLNDKEDTELRIAFFGSIVNVVSYIGRHCGHILKPLLRQGLTDMSEFVIRKAIIAMSLVTEYSLVTRVSLCQLIADCSSFLVHPNLWIREAVCGFIAKASEKLLFLEMQCKVLPCIRRYLKYELIVLNQTELLLDALVPPISRAIYDSAITFEDIDLFNAVLEKRKEIRDSINQGTALKHDFHIEMNSSLKNLFRRLEALEMTEEIEEHLLAMKCHLKIINKRRILNDMRCKKQQNGNTDLDDFSAGIKTRVFHFSEPGKSDYLRTGLQRTNTLGSIDTNVNSDWNYSSEVLTRQSESTNSGAPSSRSTNSRPSSPPPETHLTQFISTTTDASSLHEKSFIQYRRSACYVNLTKLKNIQQDHFFEALRNKEFAEQAAWKPQLPPPGWHPRGILVAHLHEHKTAIHKLCRFPDSSLFASTSYDGFIKVWDCATFEAGSFANRSRQQFRLSSNSPTTGLAVCDGGQSLAASWENGLVGVLRVDPAATKLSLVQSKQLDPEEERFVVDMQCLDPVSQNTIVYATIYGDLVGWDIRQPDVAWRLKNGLKQGLITTFCVDNYQSWLALGTSDGIHAVWDLRFRLPITTICLPSCGQPVRIRKVIPHPTEHSWLISSVHGDNEISMWNLETGSRQRVLWGSKAPPLSKSPSDKQAFKHGVCAMWAGCIDRSPFLLAGGTDQRLRFWNLESPTESYRVLPAANDPPTIVPSYGSRLIEGTDVVYEIEPTEEKDDSPRTGPEPPSIGHRDCISDIILSKASQCFVVTASRDGVIKVTK